MIVGEFLKKQIEGSYTSMIRKSMSVAKYTALGVAPARFDGRFDQTAVDCKRKRY